MKKRKMSSRKDLVNVVTSNVMARSRGITLASPNVDSKGLLVEAFGMGGYYAVSAYAGFVSMNQTGRHPWEQQQ